MFRIENYITPILWSYFSKYVKDFNPNDFQVSLWNGGAVFTNLDLNLEVLDSELQIPLTFSSGHVQELRITVPWRQIRSEPIVLHVKSMELILKYRDIDSARRQKRTEVVPPKVPPDPDGNTENAGYMRNLISKMIANIRIVFENVVIKYIESDIAFSVNVGHATLTPTDENWVQTFVDRVVYSPDFILRKKVSFSDVNICLDRCNNAGVVDTFHDPMLYRFEFDVRIVQKYATTYTTTPYFYRMDMFLGHLQFSVTDEQIPMLVRLYNLFNWLMQSGANMEPPREENGNGRSHPSGSADEVIQIDPPEEGNEAVAEVGNRGWNTGSWVVWATDWLTNTIFADDIPDEETTGDDSTDETGTEKIGRSRTPSGDKKPPETGPPQLPHTIHYGVYINTLTIIFKAVQRLCDKPGRKSAVNKFPFLKCSIQGICSDFIMRGPENSHSLGVSSIMVHGLGFCPCGVKDCTSSEGGSSSQGGECYFEAGRIKPDFSDVSLFQPVAEGEQPLEWFYDVNHKALLNHDAESVQLSKSPAFFCKYIVTRDVQDALQNPEITEVLYQFVAAPCKILLCSGLLHRFKMINDAINNYGYEPYGAQPILPYIPYEMKYPVTFYRLVIRQPLIEILAADHPSDYSPEKRAEYFRKNGGVISAATSPRLSPDWPRMVISCDTLECSAEDNDGHFNRLRDRFLEQFPADTFNSRDRHVDSIQGEELTKWTNQKKVKKATVNFSVSEVLITFISEPVELNIGLKAGNLDLEISNFHFYSYLDMVHRTEGSISLETVTCSTRLQKRSHVLWLPFSVKTDLVFDWESTLRSPSLQLKIIADRLSVYVGPETIITFGQLSEKLTVYLQEFLPYSKPQITPTPINHNYLPFSLFSDHFKNQTLESLMSSRGSFPAVDSAGICCPTQSLIWRYTEKRAIRRLSISPLPFSFEEWHFEVDEVIKFELEWFEEVSNSFYHYHTFHMCDGEPQVAQFRDEPNRNIIASNIWRIKITPTNMERQGPFLPEQLAKSLKVESVHFPGFDLTMQIQEVELNLVNNTHYSGKAIDNSILKTYINTVGVSSDDHVLATIKLRDSKLWCNSIEEISRLTTQWILEIRVLDYETLVLEQILKPMFTGVVVTMPENRERCTLDFTTEEMYVKMGASLMHSFMYSAALWTQVINSFDSKNCVITAAENRPKILLNRVLVCNDLNFEIELFYTRGEVICSDKIPSQDCKAVSCQGDSDCEIDLHRPNSFPFKFDLTKSGYIARKIGNHPIFINVSNLSASQKLVKISGPLIVANVLDQSIHVSLFPFTSSSALTTVIPSRSVAPTYLYSSTEVEHFRFRLAADDSNPWSDCVYTCDMKVASDKPISSQILTLFNKEEGSLSKVQVWLTVVCEQVETFTRYLLVVSPLFSLRSWLAASTTVHLCSSDESTNDVYRVNGKGEEVEVKFHGDPTMTHHLKFQASPDIPPAQVSVPLMPTALSLEQTNVPKRSIDDLLKDLTGLAPAELSGLKWPYVTENFPAKEWNAEINPETEVMVSVSPLIEGLPTAVADIRPWALFVNLTGVDLLFSGTQEDEYWVPYKCVFSPKRIPVPRGKFRLGIMMDEIPVKSHPLQFSDHQERLSVTWVNKDGKVPIDCFSRLDLFSECQVACLTIETRIHNSMLVVIVRPTYSIQNSSPVELFAEGVTISSGAPQKRESWSNSKLAKYMKLEACPDQTCGDLISTAIPILFFTTDGLDYSTETPNYKYLALSCGGPWWFVQLVDCSELTSEKTPRGGIPGTQIAVTLPKVDCTILSPLYRYKLDAMRFASEAVVVGSYTKNGQVWVSICQDNAPQLIVHNKSSFPFFCVEKDHTRPTITKPRHVTPSFHQYLMVPPKTSCHFSFHSAYLQFPHLNRNASRTPDVLLAYVTQDLVDFVTNKDREISSLLDKPRSRSGNKTPSGTLLFPETDRVEWKASFNIEDHPNQFVTFEEGKSVRLYVEKVGYTCHVFVENARVREISVKAIRSRFTVSKNISNVSGAREMMPLRVDGNMMQGAARMHFPVINEGSEIENSDSEDDSFDHGPSTPPPEPEKTNESLWKINAYIPELYISMQDNSAYKAHQDKEFMGVTFEKIVFEQVPFVDTSSAHPLECPSKFYWLYSARVANFQVDTPGLENERVEFPVLMEPKSKAASTNINRPLTAFTVSKFLETLNTPLVNNIDLSATVVRVTPTELNLEKIAVKIRPVSVFIEDRLLSYVIPSARNIMNVFNEGYVVLEKCGTLVNVNVHEETEETSLDSQTMTHVTIVDTEAANPSLFYADRVFTVCETAPRRKITPPEAQSLFSRNISFAPTMASSSSGLNSSNSSVISSTMGNLRLSSVSPPPPSPLTPLEPHGSSRLAPPKWPEIISQSGSSSDKDAQLDDSSTDTCPTKLVQVPAEVLKLFRQLSKPLRVRTFEIAGTDVELTLRMKKVVYVALDRSVVRFDAIKAYNSMTTQFHVGLDLTLHYTFYTFFTFGNPVRVLGSLELLGSPGTLARTVGTGLRDLVVYPYEGIYNGPVGFVSGLGYGVGSFLRSVSSGTLMSLTNWAQSVSRNIDRLTLDEHDHLLMEAARQVELQGFTDGIISGLTTFGLHTLGAVGGLTHHPIQQCIENGPSTSAVMSGVRKGVVGAIARPISGLADLLAMTGTGILLATGLKTKPAVKKPKPKKEKSAQKKK